MSDEVCLGLRLHVPFWCSFRDPVSSNVHRTFPVPPPSTLYGLLAAALGLPQDDYSRRNEVRFAVAIENAGELVETYSKWMKAAEDPLAKAKADQKAEVEAALEARRARGELTPDLAIWTSTTLIRQKLIQPIWVVGVLCSQIMADEIVAALRAPHWPLYLGESDDPVDLEVLGMAAPQPTRAAATGTLGGIHAGGLLASLPTRFSQAARGKWELARWLVTVPQPGQPIAAASDDLVACHGHVWQFEPPPQVA